MAASHAEKTNEAIGPFERPEGASEQAVVSDVGATEPTVEFGGDGVTPLAEFNEKMEPLRKEQAERDKALREKTVADAGVIQTTTKGKANVEKHKV